MPYMATPFSAVSGGSKYTYNFYHLQLQIRIECAFRKLTHRWAILRSARPMNVAVHKTVALVLALAKLHNYCIDAEELPYYDTAFSSAADKWRSEESGTIPLVQTQQHSEMDTSGVTPGQLLDGGHHFDDIGMNGRYNQQRRYNYISETTAIPLPRDRLHLSVIDSGVTRPTPQPLQ